MGRVRFWTVGRLSWQILFHFLSPTRKLFDETATDTSCGYEHVVKQTKQMQADSENGRCASMRGNVWDCGSTVYWSEYSVKPRVSPTLCIKADAPLHYVSLLLYCLQVSSCHWLHLLPTGLSLYPSYTLYVQQQETKQEVLRRTYDAYCPSNVSVCIEG